MQTYQETLASRKADAHPRMVEYTTHVAAMTVPQALREWAAVMAVRHGETVQVHFAFYSSWIMALMIVRYGEAIGFWPTAFSVADIKRAESWKKGNLPVGVKYQGVE